MNDEELASALGIAAGPIFGKNAPWPDWNRLARLARELLTQELITALLPEERAVIEAAGKVADRLRAFGDWGVADDLQESVRRLLQSQTPKPRYYVDGWKVMSRSGDHFGCICECGDKCDALRICELLNQQRT